jgi:hypothetical protein
VYFLFDTSYLNETNLKNSGVGLSFSPWAGKRERVFVDKLICARIASYYDSDGLNSLCAAVRSKNSYLKILRA